MEEKIFKLIYGGAVILGGSLANIWAFTANRFHLYEIMLITFGGMLAGFGLGAMCHGMAMLLKKK